MRPEDLRSLLRHQPFQPLRLHLTTGIVFQIDHPDGALVGRSTITIALKAGATVEREAVVALLHIAWVERVIPRD